MPGGYPHTTDTVVGMSDETEPSVHITLGVDTHIWGLTHASLRDYALTRTALSQGVESPALAPPALTQTDVPLFVRYHGALPLGFLEAAPELGASTRWSEVKAGLAKRMVEDFLARMREVDPADATWQGPDAELVEKMKLDEVAERLIDHHRAMYVGLVRKEGGHRIVGVGSLRETRGRNTFCS